MSDYKIEECDIHYWLYAKGWYKKDNYLTDLLKIHSNWAGLDVDEEFYIVNRLTEIVFDVILKDENRYKIEFLQEMLFDLAPNKCWKVGCGKVYSYNEAIIRKCLSVMRYTTVEGLDPEKDIDETLLPKQKEK